MCCRLCSPQSVCFATLTAASVFLQKRADEWRHLAINETYTGLYYRYGFLSLNACVQLHPVFTLGLK